jgi:hypothetical protein
MLEMLNSTLSLLWGLAGSVLDVIILCGVWVFEILYHLHVSAPRLEGLLVGVLLAWIMSRREKHKVLKLASAPLKLTLDILDLIWGHLIESLIDIKEVVVGWLTDGVAFVKDRISRSYRWIILKLSSLKNSLLKRNKSDK